MASQPDEMFRRALGLLQAGKAADAERGFQRVLRARPRHAGALNMLAIVTMQLGRLAEAEEFARRAAKESPASDVTHYNYGLILKALNRPAEALERFGQALTINPGAPESWNNRGVVLNELGRHDEAVADFERALALGANYPDALCNKAKALAALKDFDGAIDAYGVALALNPALVEAWVGRGNILYKRQRYGEALTAYQKAAAIKGDLADAWLGCGNVHAQQRQYGDALAAYDRALASSPDLAEAWLGRGNMNTELKRYDDAVADFDKALKAKPRLAQAWLGRGNLLSALNRFDEALRAYDQAAALDPALADAWLGCGNLLEGLGRFEEALLAYDRALACEPDLAGAWLGRGNVLFGLSHYDHAEAAYDKALALKSDLAEAWAGRGNLLLKLQKYDEAAAAYDRAFGFDPGLKYLDGYRLHARQFICEWTGLNTQISRLLAKTKEGQPASAPFALIAVEASPADRLRCAQRFFGDKYHAAPPLWRGEQYRHDRIRVAYLSADFRQHATSVLLAGMLECHDRSRFETVAISWGADDNSEMRARVGKSVERFVDVRAEGPEKIAAAVRDLEIDIAIDLMGFTHDARTSIFTRRPAPVQVNYLGYPGTMGSDVYDYIVVDDTVVPEEQRNFYSEKVVWLPNCYQVNDRKRRIAEQAPTRGQFELPENGFVFCSFNNSYKIMPDVFDVWMRLLRGIDGSVLWLLEAGAVTSKNLRREAEQRGVASERLIFAPRAPLPEHLARHRLADLFLDTLPCNAHTTASDALWAGLPIVTCLGSTFAGRVAASLLKAAGLAELVTATLADYEALALKLARDPEMLGALTARLAANRLTCPLFDTPRYTRHIEAAYIAMWERHQRGEPPAHFAVNPMPQP